VKIKILLKQTKLQQAATQWQHFSAIKKPAAAGFLFF